MGREILENEDGDGPAAMRYDSKCGYKDQPSICLMIWKKDTVDFQLNFDDSEKEPTDFTNTHTQPAG